MTTTETPDSPHTPSHRAGKSTGDWVRFGLRGLGQTLITAGLVVLLFVAYELWITNIFAHEKQVKVHTALEKQWAAGDDPLVPKLALPGDKQSTIPLGTGIANIYIPRLGTDYHFTIVEGTNDADLEQGPGHYVGSALPGQIGNFAVAGHRVGKGEPFLNLDQLKPGDPIVIETKSAWYIYRVKGDQATGNLSTLGADGVPGSQVVDPSDGNVLFPVPNHQGATPTQALMTMTTCTPKFSASDRLIVYSALARKVAKQGTELPKELTGGTL
jgi:sortase A